MADQTPPSLIVSGWRAMGFVWDVLFSVAIPTALFALGGRALDQRWNISPLFLGAGLVLSFAVAFLLVRRKARQYQEMLKENARSRPPQG